MADDQAYDHGPLQTFEITWDNGHVERIQAHQVSYPGTGMALFTGQQPPGIVEFRGEFEGFWRLVLRVPESRLSMIRNVTLTEPEVLDG